MALSSFETCGGRVISAQELTLQVLRQLSPAPIAGHQREAQPQPQAQTSPIGLRQALLPRQRPQAASPLAIHWQKASTASPVPAGPPRQRQRQAISAPHQPDKSQIHKGIAPPNTHPDLWRCILENTV